jgi:hypothetical protein
MASTDINIVNISQAFTLQKENIVYLKGPGTYETVKYSECHTKFII